MKQYVECYKCGAENEVDCPDAGAELKRGLSEAIEQLSKQHGPLNHALIKDEHTCARCKQLAKLRALT